MDFEAIGKTILSKGAPLLGLAIGGPAGAALGQVVASELGADPTDSNDVINKINELSDAKVKLLQIQDQHSEIIKQIQLEEIKLKYETISNAQQREIELAKAGHPDDTPKILALVYTAGFFLMHFILFLYPQLKDYNITTALNAGEMLVLSYYFGSSLGSKTKEKAMINMVRK
jgi:hypothetical protein